MAVERPDHPASTHFSFPYYFDSAQGAPGTPNDGIRFGDIVVIVYQSQYEYDLAIYYDSLDGSNFIDCRCVRWDTQDYNVIVEAIMNKSDLNTLFTNTRPGAVGELYQILGRPRFYDSTWQGNNTLRLLPTPSSNEMDSSTLRDMRNETLIYVKNITTSNINEDWHHAKIEGLVSGMANL